MNYDEKQPLSMNDIARLPPLRKSPTSVRSEEEETSKAAATMMVMGDKIYWPHACQASAACYRGCSVSWPTQAARARELVSNLLNGNAALSADMAARLEKTFKYPLKDLMEMQARYDAAKAKQKDAPADTRAYVPPFLAIKANDIED